jgi:hypothetical protein
MLLVKAGVEGRGGGGGGLLMLLMRRDWVVEGDGRRSDGGEQQPDRPTDSQVRGEWRESGEPGGVVTGEEII